jgi:uracil-DNA glycosylase
MSYANLTSYVVPSWADVFNKAQPELLVVQKVLKRELDNGYTVVPPVTDVYKALELTPPDNVKVVIVGQDPYHELNLDGTTQACGLAFSVRPTAPIPPSLRNIYLELQREYNDFVIPSHGDLTSWAKQGVLLLNACLTTRLNQAGAHGTIWLGFIQRVLERLTKPIYVLWGNRAKEIKTITHGRGTYLEAGHPSPYSAHRFFGCGHFRRVNEILLERGKQPIDWKLPPVTSV